MNIHQSLLLGALQGLTEFLPVSSSGHLVLLQHLFGFDQPELLFDICLHIGTLAAVCSVFYREILEIIRTLLRIPAIVKPAGGFVALFHTDERIRMAVLILVGSLPTAALGALFHEMADRIFGTVWIVGLMLLVTGGVLQLTRRCNLSGRPIRAVGLKDALVIGVVQGIAVLPGISRSGSTISAAILLGIDREVAGRYSFLLSIPAMLGALLLALLSDRIQGSASAGAILAGALTAALVGWVALKTLLHVVRKGCLYLFAPYCGLAGAAALVLSL